ncbi:MAG TPA: cellulase N-terminal Ig-like domain-containing protein, partial [Puia sp.]|nr:cellulase N-terminal Ig-like domain-containing protein [Puia sp.]
MRTAFPIILLALNLLPPILPIQTVSAQSPAASAQQAIPPPAVVLNQLGFYPEAPKFAVVTGLVIKDVFYIVSVADNAPSWQGRVDTVFFGRLGPLTSSANSSVTTRLADFSAVHRLGVYRVVVP